MKVRFIHMKVGQRLGLLAALLMLTISSFAADLNWNFTFSPSDIVLTPRGEYTFVSLTDGSNPTDAIGAPAVPAKFVNILLPDGATDITVSATGALVPLASDITPWPTQLPVAKSKQRPPFTAPNPAAYASATPWPAAAATFEGVHEMQGKTFVSVRVNPLAFVGSESALYYRPSVNVTVSYNISKSNIARKSVKGQALANEMVNALVVNPQTAQTLRRGGGSSTDVDYLIITSSSLASAFQTLADYRATAIGGGYKTLVITKESINTNYSGDDIQMKIRNCINDYYTNHGLTYVVLGGDDSVVPDRDTYAMVPGDPNTEEWNMPTDLYYSDLTGTWKATGNSNYGVLAANVDMSPEVIVGRIPVRTATQANAYITKVQNFEANLTHTRNSIIMGGPVAWCRYYGNKRPSDDVTGDGHKGFRNSHDYVSDSEMWLRRLYRDGIKPYWDNKEDASGRTINLACDAITSWDTSKCGDMVLSANNLKTWLNNGYTHMMFSGHGYPQGWGMESSGEYSSTQAAAQTALTAFIYTDACMTAAFDEDGFKTYGITVDQGTSFEYTYTSEPCLGEAFIRNANGGALVHMGCSRFGWGEPDYQNGDNLTEDSEGYFNKCTASNTSDGGPSTQYAYQFYKRLYETDAVSSNRTIGQAFAMSKADMIAQCGTEDCYRWIQFGLNYLGDPAIALYPRSVSPLDPTVLAYYHDVDGKMGAELKTAMSGIIYNRDELSWNNIWSAYSSTDVRSDGKIWDMYSNITNYTPVTSGSSYSKEGDCYNREHSFPQSWFGGTVAPMYTDLHHLYPTDGFVNGKRSNHPFGETDGNSYKSANNFSKLGTCTYPGYTGTVFEPADEYKGDFARTYFYMVTCYEEKLPYWYTNYSSTEVTAVLDGNTYPGLSAWQLEMLLKWAENDPVSEKEINRNNAVYSIQSNRNPFIDYPGLEQYIWGSLTTTAFSYNHYVQPGSTTPTPPDPVPVTSSGTYELVTNVSQLAAGDKILIANVGEQAYLLSTTQNTNNRAATTDVTLYDDGSLTPGDAAQIITLEKDGANFLFNVGTGYLYAASSSGNQLKTKATADDNAKASISISENKATITFQGDKSRNTIRFNPNSGSPLFSCYASNSTTGSLPQIYRERTLDLANAATNNSAAVSAQNGKKSNVTLSGRTFYKDGAWNTICLPFNLVLEGSPLQGAVAKTLDDATMTGTDVSLAFGAAVTELEAGKPYIIKWTSGEDIVDPTFNGVTIVGGAPAVISKANGDVKFIGYYDAFDINTPANDDIYYMTSDNTLKHTGKARTLKACRAYFQFAESSSVKSINLDFGDEETTSLSEELRVKSEESDGAWFDLSGRKLNAQPTAKGIYIHGNRKVVIK